MQEPDLDEENGVPTYSVRICYHTNEGCRWESLKMKSALPADLPSYQLPIKIFGVSGRLAEAGWEPVASEAATSVRPESLLLKRRKP